MLQALFARLFPRRLPPPGSRPRVAASAPAARGAPPPPERRAPAAAPVGVGARRPLISTNGAVAGFEFCVHPASNRLRRRDDDIAARAHVDNVLGAMRLCVGQDMIALARLPAAALLRSQGDGLFVPGMHLVLQFDPAGPGQDDSGAAHAALLQRLRSAGVKLGWHAAAPQLGRPDFVALPAPATPDDTTPDDTTAWHAAIAAAAVRWPGLPQVLLDLPDVDVMEAVLRAPVTLVACAVGKRQAATARVQALPPQAQRLLRLLNRLVRDDDNVALVNDIKADAALSLRLLHHLNSAGASPGRELDSIDQAVLVLGRDALYGWVSHMLVQMAPRRPAADGLQAMALARARLLENLARARGDPAPGSHYLLGLASMLPVLLQCSVDDALESMPLPQAAVQALRHGSGPFQTPLALAQALERNDLPGAELLAGPYGGLDAVLAHSAQAWLKA